MKRKSGFLVNTLNNPSPSKDCLRMINRLKARQKDILSEIAIIRQKLLEYKKQDGL